MEGKRRQKGKRLIKTKSRWNRRVKLGLVFKRKAKLRNRRQKFLKVGQKFRSMRDRQRERGLHDSRRRAEVRRGG